MGEARKKQQRLGAAGEIRYLAIRNEVRWIALQILRDCAAESREEKRHLYRAIAALDYEEEEKDAVDAVSEDITLAWNRVRVHEGHEEELEHRATWKALVAKQKKWKKETEVLALATETLKTIVEQIMGYKKLAGGGAELLVPWCDALEEAVKAAEGDPVRVPPKGFYPEEKAGG